MKRKVFLVLGIMSGTSIDGLDFSLIRSDGVGSIKIIKNHYYRFNKTIREEIISLTRFYNLKKSFFKNREYYLIEKKFTDYLQKKTINFLSKLDGVQEKVDLVGFHGNTIIHNPKKKISIQLGNPKVLAEKIKIPVVANFRNRDIENFGEGAPLVPIFHKSIFSKKGKNILIVNIGGISNFTYLSGKTKFLASDIGPGNTLIDRVCMLKFKKNFDKGGLYASKGKINYKLVEFWMKNNLFKKRFPKSFDVKNFKLEEFSQGNELNNFNYLRSLTFLTAKLISNIEKDLNKKIDYWVFSGGGINNLILMSDIKKLIGNEKVYISNELGFDSSFVESSAFGYISIRTIKKLPSAFPNTTGCKKKNICGDIFYP